jgi:hypothetical protein
MVSDTPGYGRSLSLYTGQFWGYYKQSRGRYFALTVAPFLFALGGVLPPTNSSIAHGLAAVFFVASFVVAAIRGRPYGIKISCTPTHCVDGGREPDKPSENRGNILLQEDTNKLHGEVDLSNLRSSFDLRFETTDGINAELENVPRSEHDYSPRESRLQCGNVTEYTFPIKVLLVPAGSASELGRYHALSIVDEDTGTVLQRYDAIDVRSGSAT